VTEIIVGDLMREFGYRLDQVLDMGFFEAHRLWMILDEIKARDLQHRLISHDFANSTDEKRSEILDWVYSRQPRTRSSKNEVPNEVIQEFRQRWNNG
jgi:hypothetical protein